ncbi:MAG: hypothetical protein DI538_30050, partial [Azospira oryzae]
MGTVRIGQGPMNMMNRPMQMQMGPMNGMNVMPLMGYSNQMQPMQMRPNNQMSQQQMMMAPPSLMQGMQPNNMMMQNRMYMGGPPPQQMGQMNRPPPSNYPPGVSQDVSPAEFEEIMSRNRTVSSSAITRKLFWKYLEFNLLYLRCYERCRCWRHSIGHYYLEYGYFV